MPTADIWQKNSLKYTGQPKVTLLESSYCKHFPSRIPLSTWFWSISTPEKLLAFKIWLSRSNFTFYERADWWKKNHGVYDASYNGVISDRATPATQNGHDKSIRHRFQVMPKPSTSPNFVPVEVYVATFSFCNFGMRYCLPQSCAKKRR